MFQGEKFHGQSTAKLTIIVLIIVFLAVISLSMIKFFDKIGPTGMPQDSLNVATTTEMNQQIKEAQEIEQQKVGSFDITKLAAVEPVRPADDKDHVWGDLKAPVQIIVYDDFECPFCAEYFDVLEQAKKDFGEQVAIVFRHNPLVSIHAYALKAAEASECAAEQGKFWEMYRLLFADNKAGRMYDQQFKIDAKTLGLKQVEFDMCLDSGKYKDKVLKQMLEAKKYSVNGAPTTFINSELVVGANPYEDMVASDGRNIEGIKSIITRHLKK